MYKYAILKCCIFQGVIFCFQFDISMKLKARKVSKALGIFSHLSINHSLIFLSWLCHKLILK